MNESVQNLGVNQGPDLLSLFQFKGGIINSTSRCSNEVIDELQLNRKLIAIIVTWVTSFLITIILAFAERRVHCRPRSLFGRPGLPIPMDFLITPRERAIYVILFAVMGTTLINGYNNFSSLAIFDLSGNDPFREVLNTTLWLPFLTVVTLVLQYFPLFACVEFPLPILGYSLGFLYSLIWYLGFWIPRFLFYNDYAEHCYIGNMANRALISRSVLSDAPLILLGGYIVLWYGANVGMFFLKLCCRIKPSSLRHSGIKRYHIDRIKTLLKTPEEKKEPTSKVKKIVFKILKYLFPFQRNYKLPLPLVGAIVAMVMAVYQISCILLSEAFYWLSLLAPVYSDISSLLANSLANSSEMGNTAASLFETIGGSIFIGVPTVIAIAPFVSVSICIFLLIHMVASISKQVKKVAKSGFEERLPPRHKRLSGFWAYTGLQIGLFFAAWVLYTVLFILAGLLVIIVLLMLQYSQTRTYIFTFLLTLIPLVWARVIFFVQTLLCKYVFLEDKNKEKDVKFIPITNRRLFQWFSLVLFFYNGFAGIVAAIVRIAISALFGLILIFRLDLLSLPKELWWWDFSHKSFLSFIYLDYCYNNSVLQVFTRLLVVSIKENRDDVKIDGFERAKSSKSNLIRNRWLVAYTLIRNPSLQQYTAKNIKLLKKNEKKERIFSLENIIKSHSEEKVAGAEKLACGENDLVSKPNEVAAMARQDPWKEENSWGEHSAVEYRLIP